MATCPTCKANYDNSVAACPRDGTALVKPLSSLVGSVIGERYRVVRELGEGGMGRVYLTEHVVLGKRFALKVLRDEFCAREELVKRFQQEAIAASRIGQENIVNVSDFGRTPQGSLYFVMEYLEGQNLADSIKHGAMPVSRAIPILIQITKALAAAHSQGIIHRDLKPDNVVLGRKEDGTDLAKVLDFGISKVGETKTGVRLTQQGMVVGTPAYMSPEQAVGGDDLDARSDIYSLGVVAYELIAGKVPFEGQTDLATLLMHQNDMAPPMRTARPDLAIPVELDRLVLRMLAKDPGDRPQTMVEVGTALSAMIGRTFTGPTAIPLMLSSNVPTDKVAAFPDPEKHRSTGPMEAAQARSPAPAPRPAPSPTSPPASRPPSLNTEELSAVKRSAHDTLAVVGVASVFGIIIGGVALALWPKPTPRGSPPVSITQVDVPQRPTPPPPVPAPAPAPTPPPAPAPTAAAGAPPATPAPTAARVQLRSTPSGAAVSSSRGRLGFTPLAMELPAGGTERLEVSAAGYRSKTVNVSSSDTQVEVRLDRVAPSAASKTAASPEGNPYGKVDELKQDPYH